VKKRVLLDFTSHKNKLEKNVINWARREE